jgi:hypothetical protein
MWFDPKGSCAGNLISSIVILKNGRTFKRWGLLGGDWVMITFVQG